MSAHRLANVALFVLIFAAWAVAMDTDFHADQVAMDAERREWAAAVAHCKKKYRVEITAELDDEGNKVCVTRRGEVLPWI